MYLSPALLVSLHFSARTKKNILIFFHRLKFESNAVILETILCFLYIQEYQQATFLMADVDENLLCKLRPTGVSENATSVVDLDHVSFGDIKSDDIGCWKGTGTKSVYFRVSKGQIMIAPTKPSTISSYNECFDTSLLYSQYVSSISPDYC